MLVYSLHVTRWRLFVLADSRCCMQKIICTLLWLFEIQFTFHTIRKRVLLLVCRFRYLVISVPPLAPLQLRLLYIIEKNLTPTRSSWKVLIFTVKCCRAQSGTSNRRPSTAEFYISMVFSFSFCCDQQGGGATISLPKYKHRLLQAKLL